MTGGPASNSRQPDSWQPSSRQPRPAAGGARRGLYLAQVFGLVGLLVITGAASSRQKRKKTAKQTATKTVTTSSATNVSERVIYQGGLKNDWKDFGWSSDRKLGADGAKIDVGNWQGWILDRNAAPVEAGTIVLRYKVEGDLGEFLQIGVTPVGQNDVKNEVPVPVSAPDGSGFRSARISVSPLAASNQFFQIRLRPTRKLPVGTIVTFASISTEAPLISSDPATAVSAAPGQQVDLKDAGIAIDCQVDRKEIDPRIYGISYTFASYLKADTSQLGATINRWGGNTTSRFNFKSGNAWNTSLDYYFRNVQPLDNTKNAIETFFQKNESAGRMNAVTVPMLGWVAKDTSSYSFSSARLGKQKENDPDVRDAGNGQNGDGRNVTPPDPSTTSTSVGPEDVGQWVGSQLKGRTNLYFLDNEIELWNSTHRDVHPEPSTYDEVLDKSIRYASAIKKADPKAIVAGPASWGWPAYSFSALDAQDFSNPVDRKAHGNKPLLAWYLSEMKKYQDKTGQRLLDILDVHFYPQQTNVYGGGVGGTDPVTSALRLRSTRGLWDPSYRDESWIDESVKLLPRMKQLIDENYPGTGLSIGEWSFGGEGHMSGGLATAEALGRFGEAGVTAAFYWTAPPANSPSFWAFRAFRNVDGKGLRFLDASVEAKTRTKNVSAFASVDNATSQMVLVLLNMNPSAAATTTLATKNCKQFTSTQTYTYDGSSNGFAASAPQLGEGTSTTVTLPKYSITVLKATLG